MKNERTVLVCVTVQSSSENLIRAGKAMAVKNSADLEIVSVIPVDEERGSFDPEALDRLYSCAKAHGGEMAVYFSDEPTITVAAHIGKSKPETIVVGFPGENSNNFISTIKLLFPHLPISMVAKDNTVYNLLPFEANSKK